MPLPNTPEARATVIGSCVIASAIDQASDDLCVMFDRLIDIVARK